jgi:hypothetical protein
MDEFTFDDVTVVMGTYNEATAVGSVLDRDGAAVG